ncbi:MAG: hypothetical protein JWM74_5220, partial [Myxococcaceae bacterium]|nr:hypothetical protein [Myxococcaceae bacterium]
MYSNPYSPPTAYGHGHQVAFSHAPT